MRLTLITVALGFFCSPWEDLHLATWSAPTFTTSPNMSVEIGQPVAASAMTQLKRYPNDEEEPAIWFRLMKTQSAEAGIKSQKVKYANALAFLPKQVLHDILDTVYACNESDQPFDGFMLL